MLSMSGHSASSSVPAQLLCLHMFSIWLKQQLHLQNQVLFQASRWPGSSSSVPGRGSLHFLLSLSLSGWSAFYQAGVSGLIYFHSYLVYLKVVVFPSRSQLTLNDKQEATGHESFLKSSRSVLSLFFLQLQPLGLKQALQKALTFSADRETSCLGKGSPSQTSLAWVGRGTMSSQWASHMKTRRNQELEHSPMSTGTYTQVHMDPCTCLAQTPADARAGLKNFISFPKY